MHDESPAGIAVKDRALAYWTGPQWEPAMPKIKLTWRMSYYLFRMRQMG